MFDSLDERIRQDDASETTPRERMFKWIAIAVLSVVVFGGIYFAIQMFE